MGLSLNSFATPEIVLNLSKEVIESGSKKESDSKIKFVKFYRGPIQEGEGFKYSIEYMAEATGYENENGDFTLQELEVSIMSLPYCNYVYLPDEGYRFQRQGMIYGGEGEALTEVYFTRSFSKESNNGVCSMGDDISKVVEGA